MDQKKSPPPRKVPRASNPGPASDLDYPDPTAKEAPGLGLASLAVGLGSIFIFWLPLIGFFAPFVAISLGVISLKKDGDHYSARIGLISGIIGLIVHLVLIILLVFVFEAS